MNPVACLPTTDPTLTPVGGSEAGRRCCGLRCCGLRCCGLRRRVWWPVLAVCVAGLLFIVESVSGAEVPTTGILEVEPAEIHLIGPGAAQGLLLNYWVNGERAKTTSQVVDATHIAQYEILNPSIASVSKNGVVSAISDGQTEMEIRHGSIRKRITVTVVDSRQPRRHHFENDIVPILSRFGCNTSGCHGKAEGQNGFKLSVFGTDPAADYLALTKEGRGRRVNLAIPEASLILQKANGGFPHGGGARIQRDSIEYQLLLSWIAAGTPMGDPEAARVIRLQVSPAKRILPTGARQQLRVTAHFSDGRRADVTSLAKFQSNNMGLAGVDDSGLVEVGNSPGQVAVMASYLGAVDVFQVSVPQSAPILNYPSFPESNFIDRHVHAKLRELNILPSDLANDAEFLRRVYIDVIGTLPTTDEAREFLDDRSPDKRQRLVERLLKRPEYADYWAMRWADLLRVDRRAIGRKSAHLYYRWIREAFAQNLPYDEFTRRLITAAGTTRETPQIHFYQAVSEAGDIASTFSQVFLGVRIACAKCHHHPFDRWSQDDYYGMTAYFRPVVRKSSARGELLVSSGNFTAKNPRSGKEIVAHPLGNMSLPADSNSTSSEHPDARIQLARWMTAPENPWFARNVANRVWAHMMGRGLIEPVDDFRDTNPPSNPELLDALANHFAEQNCDLHQLILSITASQTYQRSSLPNSSNEMDEQNYSRALLKRIPAEVLLDAVSQVSGVREEFPGDPTAQRAIQLWDSELDHYFLKLFGRPTRKTSCDCERSIEPNVGQVLFMLNSPEIHAKLRHDAGRIQQLASSVSVDTSLVDELYLAVFARYPDEEERRTALKFIASSSSPRREIVEDLAWSLMNTLEFVFNH